MDSAYTDVVIIWIVLIPTSFVTDVVNMDSAYTDIVIIWIVLIPISL